MSPELAVAGFEPVDCLLSSALGAVDFVDFLLPSDLLTPAFVAVGVARPEVVLDAPFVDCLAEAFLAAGFVSPDFVPVRVLLSLESPWG